MGTRDALTATGKRPAWLRAPTRATCSLVATVASMVRAVVGRTHGQKMDSFVSGAGAGDAANGDFPLENLPWGVFSPTGSAAGGRRVGVALGDSVVDVGALQQAGLLSGPHLSSKEASHAFSQVNCRRHASRVACGSIARIARSARRWCCRVTASAGHAERVPGAGPAVLEGGARHAAAAPVLLRGRAEGRRRAARQGHPPSGLLLFSPAIACCSQSLPLWPALRDDGRSVCASPGARRPTWRCTCRQRWATTPTFTPPGTTPST